MIVLLPSKLIIRLERSECGGEMRSECQEEIQEIHLDVLHDGRMVSRCSESLMGRHGGREPFCAHDNYLNLPVPWIWVRFISATESWFVKEWDTPDNFAKSGLPGYCHNSWFKFSGLSHRFKHCSMSKIPRCNCVFVGITGSEDVLILPTIFSLLLGVARKQHPKNPSLLIRSGGIWRAFS